MMERLVRLDGLRGVLAVYVMLGHALPFTGVPGWVAAPFVHGEAAVDLFFCLSGLVVINSLERFGFRAWPFFVARGWRLLPVYWLVLGLACLVMFAGSPLGAMPWVGPAGLEIWGMGVPAGFGWHLMAHVVLLQGVVPQGVLPWAYLTLLGPAWSLSTEWQFYGLMAAVMRRGGGLARFALGLAGVAVAYRGVEGLLPGYWQFGRAFLPDAAGYFALGLASAVWLRGQGGWILGVVLGVVVGLGVTSGEVSKGVVGVAWVAVLAVQRFEWVPVLPRLLEGRAAQWLGAISYPLYLVNEPVQRAAAMVVAPWVRGDVGLFTVVWLPLAVGAPVLAAWVIHRWVERTLMHGGPRAGRGRDARVDLWRGVDRFRRSPLSRE
jgi:peptidoglycan/LPS O-acetylase OafA/YrhL